MNQQVLIVDDEPHIRRLLAQALEALEDQGVELASAANGAEALARIRARPPELVVLDVMMPVMNGFDVCRAVKADAALRGVFVLILTAKGQELDRATAAEVGADGYMTKPFDPDALLSRAASVLGVAID